MLTALAFIFVLGVLIFFHELGHFLIAKMVGIKVDRFSLGFPPNILARKFGDTTYCIGCIPLGGYVKMAGENPGEEIKGAPFEFMSKSIPQRTAVIVAGPAMNYFLAIAILIGIYYFGGQPVTDLKQIVVAEVFEGGPADRAGVQVGDQIIAVNGEPIPAYDSLTPRIRGIIEAPVDVTWIHSDDTITATITTQFQEEFNIEGGTDSVGVIGILFTAKVVGHKDYNIGQAAVNGFITAHVIVYETVKFVKRLVVGEVSTKMLGGPLFIARQSGREARKGASSLFFFMALLSINLGVLNILPIPMLDGGHLVFLGIEKIKGSPLSMKARIMAQQVGLIGLLTLIVFVTYNDILRAFGALS